MDKLKWENEIQEYVKTALWTILAAIIVVSIIVADLRMHAGERKYQPIEATERRNTRLSLDELHYLEKTDPLDYTINLKLALLHELLQEYDKAALNYEKALLKSNNALLAVYKAAMFYAEQNNYRRAMALAALFPNSNDKKTCEIKARFYSELAGSFLEDEDFPNSIKVYKMAYKYARNVSEELGHEVAKQYSNAYTKFAEIFIEEHDLQHAAQMLQNAYDILPDPYIIYKLGLIYRNIDDITAQKYIEEAYGKKPEIVNIEIYNSLLNKLIDDYTKSGELSKARFYNLKLENLKRKVVSTTIFKDEIKISNVRINAKSHLPFISKRKYCVIFDITNNTDAPLDNLFVKVILHAQGQETSEAEAKIISRNNPINAHGSVKNIEIRLPEYTHDTLAQYGEIQILAKKNIRSSWTIIDYLTVRFTK